ncbi:TPA: ANR family transcriptional regulator [Escherichia coli]|nr:ANR family transcriptional regulator [Escherichia coli]
MNKKQVIHLAAKYYLYANDAVILERNGDYSEAWEKWNKARYYSRKYENIEWCTSRAERCKKLGAF